MEIVILIKFNDPLRPLFYCTSTFLKSIFTNVCKQQKPTMSRLLFCLCGRGGIIAWSLKGGLRYKINPFTLFITFVVWILFVKTYVYKRISTTKPDIWSGFNLSLRKGRDSNPRYRFQYDSLANCSFRPLRHPSSFWHCKHKAIILFCKVNFIKKIQKLRKVIVSDCMSIYCLQNNFHLFFLAEIVIDPNMVNALQHCLENGCRFCDFL